MTEFEPRDLTRKSFFVISYNAFGSIFGYVTLFFVYRFVGQTAWGIVGSATALVGILTILADLGLSNTHIKKLPEHRERFSECMGAYLILKFIVAGLFLVVSFLSIFVFNNFFGIKFESEYLKEAVILIIFYYFLGSISAIFKTTFRAQMKTYHAILPDFLKTTTHNTIIIALTVWWKANPVIPREAMGVLYTYAYVLGAFVQLTTFIYLGRKYEFKYPSKDIFREYRRFTIPVMLLGMINTIQLYTDRAMLQFFWNSYEVGGYFGVQKIAQAVMYLASSVVFVLYPAQSYHFSKDNKERFKEVTFKAERYLSLISFAIVSFGIALAPEILNIWNKSLINYSTPMRILLIYSYLWCINVIYSTKMVSAGKPYENLKVGMVQAFLNVFLNAILIPTSIFSITLFGLKSTGAALATFLSYLVGFIFLRYKVKKVLGTEFNPRILLHILAGGISALIIYAINDNLYHFVRIYEIGFAFGIFLAIYAGILCILKELTKEDLNVFLRGILKIGGGKKK